MPFAIFISFFKKDAFYSPIFSLYKFFTYVYSEIICIYRQTQSSVSTRAGTKSFDIETRDSLLIGFHRSRIIVLTFPLFVVTESGTREAPASSTVRGSQERERSENLGAAGGRGDIEESARRTK